ncbi:MAG: hypothetical protein FWG70_06055 [Oscillospiraceae bacterium]|nr:hypothetical protein [Oscillospiraceae bacterium]
MENNNNFTEGFTGSVYETPQAAVAVKKSRAGLIVTMVCMFLAGAMAAGLLHFFANRGTSYEKAERNSLNAMTSGILALNQGNFNAFEGSITITPSKEVLALANIPDMGGVTLGMETIFDGSDFFARYMANALGIDLSASLWLLGDQVAMQIPEISQYYILLDSIDIEEIREAFELINGVDFNEDLFMKELAVIGEKVTDRYFELTKDAEAYTSQEVSAGNLSRVCDVYEITADGEFILDIMTVAVEAVFDSDEIMRVCKYFYDLENDPYKDSSWYQSFDEAVDEMREELYDLRPRDITGNIKMNVFISGNEIIRRDITAEDVVFSYTAITDKSGEYAVNVKFSVDDDFTITCKDSGNIDKDGRKTGKADLSFDDGWDSFEITVRYDDLKLEQNGMFSGDIAFVVTLENELTVEVKFSGTVSGDSQRVKGSVVVFGMKVVDIEASYSVGNKRIAKPDMNNNNTLDASSWQDMEIFEDEIMEWAYSLEQSIDPDLMDSLEDLFEMIYDSIFGYGYYGGSGWDVDWEDDWDDDWDDDWGSLCFDCGYYHFNFEDCVPCYLCDFAHYDMEDCLYWCEDCGYNHDGDCWSYDECEKCGWYHWNDEDGEYYNYELNSQTALWKVLAGSDFDAQIWNGIVEYWGDCFPFLSEYEILNSWNDYGFDFYEEYDAFQDISWSVDIYEYIDEDVYNDAYVWSAEQWEKLYRDMLSDNGFNFR